MPYYFQVGGHRDFVGSLVFNVVSTPIVRPDNDNLPGLIIPSDALPFTHMVDTTRATRQEGETDECVSGGTVWYQFTPDVDMEVTANTEGSDCRPSAIMGHIVG